MTVFYCACVLKVWHRFVVNKRSIVVTNSDELYRLLACLLGCCCQCYTFETSLSDRVEFVHVRMKRLCLYVPESRVCYPRFRTIFLIYMNIYCITTATKCNYFSS